MAVTEGGCPCQDKNTVTTAHFRDVWMRFMFFQCMLEILLLSLLSFVCGDPAAVKEKDNRLDNYYLQYHSVKNTYSKALAYSSQAAILNIG